MTEAPTPHSGPGLTPPPTRAAQAWTRFWQRYVGDGPAQLIRMNQRTIPAIRAAAQRGKVRR